jgi:hypothetical protein
MGFWLLSPFRRALGRTMRLVALTLLMGTEIGRRTTDRYSYEDVPSGFAVSPSGGTILYSRLITGGADLMVIENFR